MPELLRRIIEGDSNAIEEFYQTYSPKLELFLRRKLPGNEDTQEILNDVFLAAIDQLALFKKQSKITTWLCTIAKHKIADYYRKRKIKSVLFSQIPFLELVSNNMHEPEFIFEKNRVREKIHNTIHSLSARYRTILRMRYEEQKPIKQIANELNMSFKATESLLFRARKEFQQIYGTE